MSHRTAGPLRLALALALLPAGAAAQASPVTRPAGAAAKETPEALAARYSAALRMMGGAESTFLGHVTEGADVAHVVFRMRLTMGEMTVERVNVMSMRRRGDGWGVLLSGEIEGMAAALKRRPAG